MRPRFALLIACFFAALPATAQSASDPMRGCAPGDPGVRLVGIVTDAETRRPLRSAFVRVEGHALDMSDSIGCYAIRGADEIVGRGRRLVVDAHHYVAADTLVDFVRGQRDTLHFALHPAAPPCCRLEGEWSLRLVLDTIQPGILRPRAREVEGRMVFSGRLPPRSWIRAPDPAAEDARFDVDLSVFFGAPYHVSTPAFGGPADLVRQAFGEVLADDSVMMQMIPGVTHVGLSLYGTIRGDTVTGTWAHNASCCGARGHFVMHRVPASAAGDSLVTRGIRAAAAWRAAENKERQARAAREGHLRLRVWDEGTGRYVQVRFAAEGHEDNPGGGSSSIAYESGPDGWGRRHAFEPGRYDLLVYELTCDGETRMGDWVDPDETTPRWPVTIESRKQVDLDIRVDVCSIPDVPDDDPDDAVVSQVSVPAS